MKKNLSSTGLRWLWLALLTLTVDLVSKYWVTRHFMLNESVDILPCFSLTYVQNIGAAFSMLAGQRWPLIVIALVVCIILGIALYKHSVNDRLNNIAYSLIIGGALGNFFDRLVHGYVVDFFHVYLIDWHVPFSHIVINEWHYPIFNVADIAICCGAGLIILDILLSQKKTRT